MNPEESYVVDDNIAVVKTIRGAATGFLYGTVWGSAVATWYGVPFVKKKVVLPGLIKSLKLMGNYGLTFGAIRGVYIGVDQLVQHHRMKRDYVNGAVAGFVAGASVFGYKRRSLSTALSAGALLAVTSAVINVGGQPTILDDGGKERSTVDQ